MIVEAFLGAEVAKSELLAVFELRPPVTHADLR